MSEQGPDPAVVLTGAARSAKAALGPTAGAVLEELVLCAERAEDGRLVATTSVRRLGTALGLDKDTAARALARLSSGGFVLRAATERSANGSCYVIVTLSGLTRVGAGSDPVVPHTAVRPSVGDRVRRPESGDSSRPRPSRRSADGDGGPVSRAGQLSLLADDEAPNDATSSSSSPTPHPLISTTDASKNHAHSNSDLEPDDDHHHRHETSPIQHPDSCHPSGEDVEAPSGRHGGGGGQRC
jgi:hypothetical protein